jgi:surface protein
MFDNCSSLTTLDVSNWDTSSVTTMSDMFRGCSSLTTLDVSNWNVSKVTNMSSMFYGCSLLTTLDVSNWDVSNVNYMNNMFSNTPLDTASYDALLIGWSQLPSLKSNVRLDANQAKYSSGAATTARGILTSAPNYWKIYDGGQVT